MKRAHYGKWFSNFKLGLLPWGCTQCCLLWTSLDQDTADRLHLSRNNKRDFLFIWIKLAYFGVNLVYVGICLAKRANMPETNCRVDKIGNPELTFSSLAFHVISLNVLLNYLGNMKLTAQKCSLECITVYSHSVALTMRPRRNPCGTWIFWSFSCYFISNEFTVCIIRGHGLSRFYGKVVTARWEMTRF